MEKQKRLYTVITSAGYWGKGETALEAAKNANVRGTKVNGSIYFANPDVLKGEVECTGMGGTKWTWQDEFFGAYLDAGEKPTDENVRGVQLIHRLAQASIKKASGAMRISKGKLYVEAEF